MRCEMTYYCRSARVCSHVTCRASRSTLKYCIKRNDYKTMLPAIYSNATKCVYIFIITILMSLSLFIFTFQDFLLRLIMCTVLHNIEQIVCVLTHLTYIHTHAHTHTYIHPHPHTHIHIYIHTHIQVDGIHARVEFNELIMDRITRLWPTVLTLRYNLIS